MSQIKPSNLSAQLTYRARGNPPNSLPETAISNCFPGLEFDFRNIWRRILVGIVIVENNNYVIEAEDPAFKDLLHHRLLRIDGNDVVTRTFGPISPRGGPRDLATSQSNPVAFMEWSNTIAKILNKQGQRMSKSLGTGVDPLDLVGEYGADALRFGLITSGSTHQQDIRFSPERVEQARNFANKVWNVARFILTSDAPEKGESIELTAADRWILSRLNTVIASVTHDLERYELSGAGQALHDFVWSELADWYVEMAKVRMYGDDLAGRRTVRAVLWSVLDRSIRLLQPYMPFLSEEIWQHLRRTGSAQARELSGWHAELPESVMVAPWPKTGATDAKAERALSTVLEIIGSARTVRAEYRVDPGKFISATIVAGDAYDSLAEAAPIVSRLARLAPIDLRREMPEAPGASVALLHSGVSVYLPLAELTNVEAERERLRKELADAERGLAASNAKLGNESFISRAPEAVVARERERAGEMGARTEQLRAQLAALEGSLP